MMISSLSTLESENIEEQSNASLTSLKARRREMQRSIEIRETDISEREDAILLEARCFDSTNLLKNL